MASRNLLKLARLVLVVALIHLSGCGWTRAKFAAVGTPYFVLMDEGDNVRGLFYAHEDGSAIVLKDGSGHTRIRLFAVNDAAGIVFLDGSGKNRLLLMTQDDLGVTYAALLDDKGDIASILGRVLHEGSQLVSQEQIQGDAKRLLEKLSSGWLEGLREIDKQAR